MPEGIEIYVLFEQIKAKVHGNQSKLPLSVRLYGSKWGRDSSVMLEEWMSYGKQMYLGFQSKKQEWWTIHCMLDGWVDCRPNQAIEEGKDTKDTTKCIAGISDCLGCLEVSGTSGHTFHIRSGKGRAVGRLERLDASVKPVKDRVDYATVSSAEELNQAWIRYKTKKQTTNRVQKDTRTLLISTIDQQKEWIVGVGQWIKRLWLDTIDLQHKTSEQSHMGDDAAWIQLLFELKDRWLKTLLDSTQSMFAPHAYRSLRSQFERSYKQSLLSINQTADSKEPMQDRHHKREQKEQQKQQQQTHPTASNALEAKKPLAALLQKCALTWEPSLVRYKTLFPTLLSCVLSQKIAFRSSSALRRRILQQVNKQSFSDLTLQDAKQVDWTTVGCSSEIRQVIQRVIEEEEKGQLTKTWTQLPGIGKWTVKAVGVLMRTASDLILLEDKWIQRNWVTLFGLRPSMKDFRALFPDPSTHTAVTLFLWRLTNDGCKTLLQFNEQLETPRDLL